MKKLGIIGGLGPLASSYFYTMITNMTDVEKDQEHIDIVILSHSSIPDRTEYILDHSKKNPYPYLLEDVKTLENLGVDMIAIPCNTSCYFHEKLQSATSIKINNMVEDTAVYLKGTGISKVAIFATDGTISSNLYQKYLNKYGIEYEVPNETIQKKIMEIIYNNVKKGTSIDTSLWNDIISSIKCDKVILGCTELSILKNKLNLNDNFIDPLEIQTIKILKYFDKKIKENPKLF